MTKEIAKWSDESMFTAQKTESLEPRVTVIHANNDPLGQLAQLAMMYQGKSVRNLIEISDEDRRYYFVDVRKNILGMPSEAIVFHFLIENVTRNFTHQLVRTRHASYAQESLRFAVKEDFPVGLPPSLHGAHEKYDELHREWFEDELTPNQSWSEYLERYGSDSVRQYRKWIHGVETAESVYLSLIEAGMPAEDARGMLPHNILTKVNMVISLRALMGMAGQRLCTQAQWEHKKVWDSLLGAIRDYGLRTVYYGNNRDDAQGSAWQFNAIADQFLPICYQTGKCQFESDFDRYCNIRDRVQANAAIGRPSSEWHKEHDQVDPTAIVSGFNGTQIVRTELGMPVFIPAINSQEWLHPNAAIRPDGNWRSEEAQANIKDRRL